MLSEQRVREIVREELAAAHAERPDVPLTPPQVRKLYAEIKRRGGSKDDLREIVRRVAGVEREDEASQAHMDALLAAVDEFVAPWGDDAGF